jgi:hypothetical protein
MLFPRLELPGVVRVSLGLQSSQQDVEALLLALGQLAGPRRAPAPGAAARASLHRHVEAAIDATARRVFSTAGAPSGALLAARAG